MQTLDVISVNIWHIVVSLLNLVLMFLIVKYFLYKPVKKMLAQRREAIDGDYKDAEDALNDALSKKAEYEEKLSDAKTAADGIIKNAVELAGAREEAMISEARSKADLIVAKAESDAALERRKAEDDIKREIAEVSALISEKILEREINADDHKDLIDSFIEGIGAEDETK